MFFAQIPSYELDIEVSFTQKKISLVNTIPQLKQFIIDGIKTAVRDRFVYPNRISFFLPFAGRSVSMRLEQVNSLRSSTPFVSNGELFKESVSRFMDEILPINKTELIPTIFTNDCKIFGFKLNGDILSGHQGVLELAKTFSDAFDEILFDISSLHVENNILHFYFICEGSCKGKLWNKKPESPASLRGRLEFTCTFTEKGALLQTVHFFWDLDCLAAILSLPDEQ